MSASVRIAQRPAVPKQSLQAQVMSEQLNPLQELSKSLDTSTSRALVLKLESKLDSFLQSPSQSCVVNFKSGYHRMLVHRCAECYALEHVTESQGGRRVILLQRTSRSCIPSPSLSELVQSIEEQATPHSKEVKILARKPKTKKKQTVSPELPHRAASKAPPRSTSPTQADASKTLEEREAEYARARARIFDENDNEPASSSYPRGIEDERSSDAMHGRWQTEHLVETQEAPHPAYAEEGVGSYGAPGRHWGAPAALPPYWSPYSASGFGWGTAGPMHGQVSSPVPGVAQTAQYGSHQAGAIYHPGNLSSQEQRSTDDWPAPGATAPSLPIEGTTAPAAERCSNSNQEQQQNEEALWRHQVWEDQRRQQQLQQMMFFQQLPQGTVPSRDAHLQHGINFVGYGATHLGLQEDSCLRDQASAGTGSARARKRQLFDPAAPSPPVSASSTPSPPLPQDYDVAVVPVAPASRSIPAAAMWSKAKAVSPVRVLTPPPQSAASTAPET